MIERHPAAHEPYADSAEHSSP